MEVKVEGIVRPPPQKHKTPPHTQPRPHTQPPSTPSPSHTSPIIPPPPPPNNPTPISPTPPQTTTGTPPSPIPPPIIETAAAQTLTLVDFMNDMEVEENLVFTSYCFTKPNRKEDNF